MARPSERFWLDETDPKELLRRADDLARDGLLAVAEQLRDRAKHLAEPPCNHMWKEE